MVKCILTFSFGLFLVCRFGALSFKAQKAANIGKAVINGKRVNRGGGYGLEIPREYQFIGDAFSISRLKEKLQKEGFDAKQIRGMETLGQCF